MPDALRQRAAEHHASAWCEVDLAAIRRNAERLSAHVGMPLAPVLKADAYGLGAVPIAQALEGTAPWGYCVATVAEGVALRQSGITRSVLVCPPLAMDALRDAHEAALIPALGSAATLAHWREIGGGAWHLSIDTGMHRAGMPWDRMSAIRDLVAAHPPQGVFTHFHSADHADGTMAEQERRFAVALEALAVRPALMHTDNSAAAARRTTRGPGSFARPGFFLFGGETGPTALVAPEPVVSVRAAIVDLRVVAAGETVSYDGTWRAPSERRIATVALGYADGYRRALSNRGYMLVRGQRAPVVGNVTMDLTMVDVTDCAAECGDVVTALGADGDSAISLSQLATLSACSPYELLVGLRLRLVHRYRETS